MWTTRSVTVFIKHIVGTNINLTTIGLAVKLHHKQDSSELVKTLNEHGITSSYDDVPQVIDQVYVGKQSYYIKKLGLSMGIGPIFSWADNYDLYIASPNRKKTTHAMGMEFTQNPAGIIETGNVSMMQLTIP